MGVGLPYSGSEKLSRGGILPVAGWDNKILKQPFFIPVLGKIVICLEPWPMRFSITFARARVPTRSKGPCWSPVFWRRPCVQKSWQQKLRRQNSTGDIRRSISGRCGKWETRGRFSPRIFPSQRELTLWELPGKDYGSGLVVRAESP